MSARNADDGGPYMLGVDFGTESVRAGVFDAEGSPLSLAATTYVLTHPRPGWAEQDPDEWWSSMVRSVREAMSGAGVGPDAIAGICCDATACTLLALDAANRPLRRAIMWMDARAADQARRIGESTHPARKYNGGGPVSVEWLPPKSLWLKEREPEVYRRAERLVECIDWLTFRLTGRWTAGINTASLKAYHDRAEGGWPVDFYEEIGLGDIFEKRPEDVLDLGEPVEGLSKEAAGELGLRAGTPVAQGGCDAFVAQIGLGVVHPGKMALITGSSHVHIGQTDRPVSGNGFFGAFTDAVIPGQYTVEAGQVSTGSVLKWFKDNFCAAAVTDGMSRGVSAYDVLNEQSRDIPLGSDGLIVCEYWQGNRTPYVDGDARGIITGLTLSHTPAHVYRAIQEGVCYGTAHIVRVLGEAGFEVREFVAAGGATHSRDWMQMHADVSGVPVTFTEVGDAAVLGCAVLAAAGAGVFPTVQDAVTAMVHETDVLEPDKDRHDAYQFFVDAYVDTYPRIRDVVHSVSRHLSADEPVTV